MPIKVKVTAKDVALVTSGTSAKSDNSPLAPYRSARFPTTRGTTADISSTSRTWRGRGAVADQPTKYGNIPCRLFWLSLGVASGAKFCVRSMNSTRASRGNYYALLPTKRRGTSRTQCHRLR
jgi:hypothetical protein